MKTPRLLMLAGISGAGKTSLLHAGLMQQQPVFGVAADADFQSICTPSRLPESLLSFEQTVREQTWFQAIQLPQLAAMEQLPDVVVLHVDLTNLLARQGKRPLTWTELRNPARVTQSLATFVAMPLFQRFGSMVVHTLQPSWAHNAQQWHGRERQHREAAAPAPSLIKRVWRAGRRQLLRPPLLQQLFDPSRSPEPVHSHIYNAWLAAVPTLRPALQIHSEWQDGELRMRLNTPQSPQPTHLTLPLRAPELAT
ncbi:MAG TPA: hypothetical protein VFW67_09530 [Burkholderiaceae bacterium]|nr:hypothetical protein [Burkholderiaceae bacterium]